MIYKAYSMYDKVVKSYGHPSFFVNDEVFKRSLMVSLQSPSSQLKPIISDIDFYSIGEFDDATGSFLVYDKPDLVFRGDSLYARDEN